MDKAANGREKTALAFFTMYFNEESDLQERVSLVRAIVNDSGWRFLSESAKMVVLKALLQKGPLSAPLERELLFLVAQLGTLEAIDYFNSYIQSITDVTFFDDGYFPNIIPFWRRWILTRRVGGQILQGEGLVRREELSHLASLWAASVPSCEQRLDRPSVR